MSVNPAEILLSPYVLGDPKLKNRIVMAPLTRTRAEVPNELMAEYYTQGAGAGLIITEGTFVSEQGQGWFGAPGIYTEEQLAGWARIQGLPRESTRDNRSTDERAYRGY